MLRPDHIVLSPGPGRPEDAGVCPELVRQIAGQIPILGICLGHQVIAHVMGATIDKALQPMHGKVKLIRHRGTGLFRGMKSPLMVTRYHSLIVDRDSLPQDLEITAWSDEGEIMGIAHRSLPLEGVQFHPEAILTENGMEMLANFLQGSDQRRSVHPTKNTQTAW